MKIHALWMCSGFKCYFQCYKCLGNFLSSSLLKWVVLLKTTCLPLNLVLKLSFYYFFYIFILLSMITYLATENFLIVKKANNSTIKSYFTVTSTCALSFLTLLYKYNHFCTFLISFRRLKTQTYQKLVPCDL